MAYVTFPWDDIGYPQEMPEMGDLTDTLKSPFEAGYIQTRSRNTRILKTISCYWRAMKSNNYLALLEFYRNRKGEAEAFYLPYPLELYGFPAFGGPTGESGPTGFEDSEVEVGFGDPPVFLVRFVGNILVARWVPPYYFGVTAKFEQV